MNTAPLSNTSPRRDPADLREGPNDQNTTPLKPGTPEAAAAIERIKSRLGEAQWTRRATRRNQAHHTHPPSTNSLQPPVPPSPKDATHA